MQHLMTYAFMQWITHSEKNTILISVLGDPKLAGFSSVFFLHYSVG